MMNADTQITLDQYYAAVVSDISARFPVFGTVEFDRGDIERKHLPVPACLLEITEFEDDGENDPGTEAWQCNARVEARIVFGFRTERVKLQCRKLATALAHFLRLRRFGHPEKPGTKLPTGAAMLVGCYEDDFSPVLDKYEVWRVEWIQNMTFGPSIWNDEGETPDKVYVGIAPDIGKGNEGQYTQIAGDK